nr:DUF4124 domain-containing protein [Aeromonas molluscorum]
MRMSRYAGFLLLVCLSAQGAKIYSWIDNRGITHYTSAPPAGQQTQEIDLRVAPLVGTTTHSVQVDNYNHLIGADIKQAELTISLLSPEPDSTLRDNTGNIVFEAQVTPAPPTQYDLRLLLDGKEQGRAHNTLMIRLENLDRGTHRVQLELLAKDGTILAKSDVVTFYLHRTRANQAANPGPAPHKG